MKRLGLFLIIICLGLSAVSCTGNASEADVDRVLAGFVAALKNYDREGMSRYLTEFPDNTGAAYTDDLFSDSSYVELYRSLYSDITYAVTMHEKNTVTIKIKMPNIGALYLDTCKYVEDLAKKNTALSEKLKGHNIVFIQEMMRERSVDTIEIMDAEFTLELVERDDALLIVCDDMLRSLMTGNFYQVRGESAVDE